jgi:Leucine-rich repeat (LRR) protein
MPLVNPKLFGVNVKSNLADLQDSNAALNALNIPSTDLDIIRGSSNAGASIGDWISLSRLSKPVYKTLDRFYQETSIYSAALSGKAGVNFPLFGNLQINGRLSGRSIRYRYVDGSGSSATIRYADISTSRVSAWSSVASPVEDTSPIFYGARVGIVTGGSLQFGTPTSASQIRLQTTITPRRKEFDSEFPTHKINCTIGGQTVSLYAMKGIPVVFSGNFRNLTASITLISPLINGIPASWKIVDADNSNIFVNYRNQGSNVSTINYTGRSQKQRFVEFYYNPNRISSISIRSASISTLPQSKFTSLTGLDLSYNSITNFPDLNSITPSIRNLVLINNPLYLNDNTNRRRLNTEVLSLIPTSLRQLYLGGTFFGSVDLDAIGERFTQLQILDLGRDGGAYFYPDTSNPSAPIPNVSDSCTSYSVRNNDFRTIGISGVTTSKNVKDLTELLTLNLSGNYNLTDATFSISASNIKIQSINVSSTGLPCPDLNGRQSLTVFNGSYCRNIGSITSPSGTYKFDGCNSLNTLSFYSSPLTGPFPKITNSNLVSLDLRGTNITGGTPEGDISYVIPKQTFSSCGQLETLYISSPNLLAGPIHPNAFDSTLSLVNLAYNSSGITSGPLPSFSACKRLRNIYFGGNRFSGSVPNFAANPNISYVDLSYNQFTGNVPAYRNLPNLIEVNLYNNQITGFPSKFTNLPALEYFRANNNQISGQIPDFRDCPKLFNLILFNNQFRNYFSGSFTLLYRIRLIDLSNNLLTQQAINLIIDDLFINYNAVKRGGVTVNLRGNTLPSATALEKITFLNSKGWTIVY